MDETVSTVTQTAAQAAQEAHQAAQQHVAQQKETFLAWIETFLTWGNLFKVISAVIVLLLLWIVYKIITRTIKRAGEVKPNKQKTLLFTKFFQYAFYIIAIMYILSCFGIKLTALLGAAGVVGLAVGFAAQTSVSNIISGLFVISEGTMKIGDFISVSGVSGTVDSVDLLSVKVHTLDNQMVRIPNSAIINSNFQNNSFYDTRRVTFAVSANYNTDIQKALNTFAKAPALCKTVLKDPAPAVWVDELGGSNINMTIAVWCKSADFTATKNQMFIAIMKVMNDAGISAAYDCIEVTVHEDASTMPAAVKTAARAPVKKAPAARTRKTSAKSRT